MSSDRFQYGGLMNSLGILCVPSIQHSREYFSDDQSDLICLQILHGDFAGFPVYMDRLTLMLIHFLSFTLVVKCCVLISLG